MNSWCCEIVFPMLVEESFIDLVRFTSKVIEAKLHYDEKGMVTII